ELMTGMNDLVSRATRIEKAGELQKQLLLQNRAEKNLLAAENDAEADRFTAEMVKYRAVVAKTRDEIYAIATETGKQILDRFATDYGRVNATQDETARLIKTDKVKAVESSTGAGRKAMDDGLAIAEEYVAYVKKTMAEQTEI